MADYTVQIAGSGAGAPWTFTVPPGLLFSASRAHRRDVLPEPHVVSTYSVRLERCRTYSSDGTADKAQEGFGAFLIACLHHRTKPTYVKILDATPAVIDEIGDIRPGTGGWEELLVTELDFGDGEAQLRAGAEFSIAFTARKVFADANGMVELEREWRSEVGPSRLETRTIRGRMRMAAGTAVPITASWFTALAKVVQPSGWGRSIGGSGGVQVDYPFGLDRTDVVEFVSQVRQLGVTPPDGAGDATEGTTRRDRPDLGLVEVTTFVEAEGASDGDGHLEESVPDGSVGETTHDRGKRLVRGSWKTWEATGQTVGGKVTRVDVERFFLPGGQATRVRLRTGKLRPRIRLGAVLPWRIVERVTVFALGPVSWVDLPTLPRLPEPWVYDPEGSREDAPRIVERGATATQTVWARTSTRAYTWDGQVEPLEDEAVQRELLRRYEAGDEGLVLT